MKAAKTELMPAHSFYEVIGNIEKESEMFFRLHEERKFESCERLKERILCRISVIEKDVNKSLKSAFSADTIRWIANKFYDYSTDINYEIYHHANEPKFQLCFKNFKDEAIKLKLEAASTMLETLECQRSKGGETTKAPIALCAAIGDLVNINPKMSGLEAWRRLKKVDWRGVISGREFSLKYDPFGDVIFQTEYIDGEPKGNEKPISQINVRDHLSKAKKYYKKKTIHKKVSE